MQGGRDIRRRPQGTHHSRLAIHRDSPRVIHRHRRATGSSHQATPVHSTPGILQVMGVGLLAMRTRRQRSIPMVRHLMASSRPQIRTPSSKHIRMGRSTRGILRAHQVVGSSHPVTHMASSPPIHMAHQLPGSRHQVISMRRLRAIPRQQQATRHNRTVNRLRRCQGIHLLLQQAMASSPPATHMPSRVRILRATDRLSSSRSSSHSSS
mmetsp:Transcript_81082/g.181300  ORF Transcript_81082/g.181300 Transcript_81082/m.181300 type:complete len:209 (+) Transcript_81082:298-924(+)